MNTMTIMDSNIQTMTSKEIADLVEVRHDNVKRTIETLVTKGVMTQPQIEETSAKDTLGRLQYTSVYQIPKRDTYVLVAQLSPEFTARLVDRWIALEAKSKQLLPQTHIQAIEAYLVTLKQVEAQQLEIGFQQEVIKEEAILTEKSQEYYTVKQLKGLVSKPSGKVLTRVSIAMGYEIKAVFSQYDGMASNTYHTDVINAVYATTL